MEGWGGTPSVDTPGVKASNGRSDRRLDEDSNPHNGEIVLGTPYGVEYLVFFAPWKRDLNPLSSDSPIQQLIARCAGSASWSGKRTPT